MIDVPDSPEGINEHGATLDAWPPALEPDPNERVCVGGCQQTFNPWSIADDDMEAVPPPAEYTCAACRLEGSNA